MLELHRKVNPKEVLVGWYSTWTGGAAGTVAGAPSFSTSASLAAPQQRTDEFTLVVHEFFKEAAGANVAPIHLLLDVSLRTPTINIFAHRPIENALLKKCVRGVAGGAGGEAPRP